MAESVRALASAKKKRRVRASHHAPFPVPIRSLTLDNDSLGKWWFYSGQLIGSCVIVNNSGDIHHLYNMGFFGKGNISRSGLYYHKSVQTVPQNKSVGAGLGVMKKQSFIRHLNWRQQKESQTSAEGEYTEVREYNSDEEETTCTENAEISTDKSTGTGVNASARIELPPLELTSKELLPFDQNTPHWVEEGLEDIEKEETDLKRKQTDDWDNQEADADFWGSEPTQEAVKVKVKEGGNVCDQDVAEVGDNRTECSEQSEKGNQSEHYESKIVEDGTDRNYVSREVTNDEDNNVWSDDTNKNKENVMKGCVSGSVSESSFIKMSSEAMDENMIAGQPCCSNNDIKKAEQSSRCVPVPSTSHSNVLETSDIQTCDTARIKQTAERKDHPMNYVLGPHDPDGNVFVISDTDVTEEETNQKADIFRKGVVKKDSYKMTENLHLGLEEAFFLSYGLRCLVCRSAQESVMDLCAMWQTFRSLQSSFIPLYISYHHFRSKGWVPKSGLKFGVDYILYKEGPPFYHASYSVIVRLVNETTLAEDPGVMTRPLTWRSLSGLNRITENVAKELMFCYVVQPASVTEEELASPCCIPKFRVQEVLLKRWIPSQERQSKPADEL